MDGQSSGRRLSQMGIMKQLLSGLMIKVLMSQIEITFLFLGAATILLVGNILRPDIVALLLLLSLGLSGILTPQEAFSGFSRSAVIIMLSAFILAEGLRRARRRSPFP